MKLLEATVGTIIMPSDIKTKIRQRSNSWIIYAVVNIEILQLDSIHLQLILLVTICEWEYEIGPIQHFHTFLEINKYGSIHKGFLIFQIAFI